MMVGVRAPWRLIALSLAGCAASGGGPGGLPAAPDDAKERTADAAPRPADEGAGDGAQALGASTPDAAAVAWQTGTQVGRGVAFKDTKNPAGGSMFVGYAGYQVTLASAEAWVEALYAATLAARGVRYLWAVQGPNDPRYSNREIGNSQLIAAMSPRVGAQTKFVLVAGHSSGSFVAHELLARLSGGLDPNGIIAGRVVYFDLDGGARGLTASSVGRVRRAYFVGSHDGKTGTDSLHVADMQSLGAAYASAGGYWRNDASDCGCDAGAARSVHATLVTTRPHDPRNARAQLDYSDFVGRPVCQSWIDAKAAEAGLNP
jgi:hypothetical protein